ncbi:MAG: methionine synthase [bacterium]|nr:methionine synthase [bacterium]
MNDLLETVRGGRILVGDGAWGTMLMARGLKQGECPEAVNLENPETLAEIASLYLNAGADIITTNTFGGSSLKLAAYGLEERTEEINRCAVEALQPTVGSRAYISASVGPTAKILKPYGDTAPEEVSESFNRQIGALIDVGVDLICIETMMDLSEARLAVAAARSLSTDIPVVVTMTFDATPRGFFTMMGNSIQQAAADLKDAGADIIGSNCGNGIEKMVEIAQEFKRHSDLPIIIQSNAGLPETRAGELIYPESPEFMADEAKQLIDLGVAIIGGCCGTGPDHIRALRSLIDQHRNALPEEP